jgi:hypothetical protein
LCVGTPSMGMYSWGESPLWEGNAMKDP